MTRSVIGAIAVAGGALALMGCGDKRVEPPAPGANAGSPRFAETVASNGSAAQCMADDGLTAPTGYVSANLLSGGASFPSFGCTANDIRVATAVISEYSLTGQPGSFIPVTEGTRLECVPNQTLYVRTVAKLANNAQSRYDIGVWIANPSDASAMSVLEGSPHQCRHYNLVVGQTGVSSLEVPSQQDACGDMAQGTGLATLDLDVLQVTCQANTSTVTVNSCIGWQNSDDFKDRSFCPTNYPNAGTPQQFRWGTLPETGSKCNCEGFSLPIDVKASLTLVKVVTNDNGGSATLSNFPLTATGPRTISGVSGTTSVTARPVDAGTYALSEQTVANYTASSWSCTGGTQNGANISLSPGGVATCTITNNDNGPRLTLVKVVTNDNGGAASTANFPLTAAGPVTITGTSGSGSVTNATVSAGTYTLSETTLAGYTPTTWSCTSGGSGNTVTLPLGGSATCTIGNNDNSASLRLIKVVTNDNGGTKTAADFQLSATGPGALQVVACSGNGAATCSVSAGTYALSEQTQAGYQSTSWSCSGGTQSGSNITLGLGGSATCTIGNNDIGPTLTLVKVVTNDHGGALTTSSFPLTAAGPVTISGTSGSTAVTNRAVNAGTYTLSETSQTGYSATPWSCTSGGDGNQVTLPLGGSATCTIGNNDIPAAVTLMKRVIGVGGVTINFNLFGSELPGTIDLTPGNDATAQVTFNNLSAGTRTITELLSSANFLITDIGCVRAGSTTPFVVGNTTTGSITFTLLLGDNVTCTFVNQRTSQTTRTQGFWATHPQIAQVIWFGGTLNGQTYAGVADKTLCGTENIDTLGKLMGGFWASIPQTTTKTKRSDLDAARMRLLQQLLAAMLNNAAFGSSPSGSISIADAEAAYCGTDINAIKAAQAAMGAFNESGDAGNFDPGMSADPKTAKSIADEAFWNVLP